MLRNTVFFTLALIAALGLAVAPAIADHHEKPAPPHGEHDHGDHKNHEEAPEQVDDTTGHEGHVRHGEDDEQEGLARKR